MHFRCWLYSTWILIWKQAFLVIHKPGGRRMCCTACRCCRAVLASCRDRGASLEEVASRARRGTHKAVQNCSCFATVSSCPLFCFFFLTLFPHSPPAGLLPTTQILHSPLYLLHFSLTSHFKKTLLASLNFIPSFSAPFPQSIFWFLIQTYALFRLQFIQDPPPLVVLAVTFSSGAHPSLPKASGCVSR